MIDAHIHLWTPEESAYPRMPGSTACEPLRFTPDDYFGHALALGVTRAVLIQMSFYGTDNSYLLDTIAASPSSFRGVAQVDPHSDDLAARMQNLSGRGIRGFRIVGIEHAGLWLDHPSHHRFWDHAAQQSLAICPLVSPESLPVVDRLCELHPDTRVVVDHFGRAGFSGEIEPRHVNALCRLARHPHTFVKVSAFYALGRKQAPYHDLLPLLHRVFDAFGPRRMMWGSDCPFQVTGGHSLEASLALIEQLEFANREDKEQLLSGTAERVFFRGELR